MTETTEVNGYRIRKSDICQIMTRVLHRSSNEWQRPHEFIPERWDPNS